jgi:hypothetical protein
MGVRAIGLGILAALVLGASSAQAIGFEYSLLILGGDDTTRGISFPITPGGSFDGTFELTPLELATDGAHDVSASLTLAFAWSPLTFAEALHTAVATVAGGNVVELELSLGGSKTITQPIIGNFTYFRSVSASGGTWSSFSSTSAPPPLPYSTSSRNGTVHIQQVPEAAGLGLVALALVLVARRAG